MLVACCTSCARMSGLSNLTGLQPEASSSRTTGGYETRAPTELAKKMGLKCCSKMRNQIWTVGILSLVLWEEGFNPIVRAWNKVGFVFFVVDLSCAAGHWCCRIDILRKAFLGMESVKVYSPEQSIWSISAGGAQCSLLCLHDFSNNNKKKMALKRQGCRTQIGVPARTCVCTNYLKPTSSVK